MSLCVNLILWYFLLITQDLHNGTVVDQDLRKIPWSSKVTDTQKTHILICRDQIVRLNSRVFYFWVEETIYNYILLFNDSEVQSSKLHTFTIHDCGLKYHLANSWQLQYEFAFPPSGECDVHEPETSRPSWANARHFQDGCEPCIYMSI